jgi:hypothetical protein
MKAVPAAKLDTTRRMLAAIFLFGSLGTTAELMLMGHTEGVWQNLPHPHHNRMWHPGTRGEQAGRSDSATPTSSDGNKRNLPLVGLGHLMSRDGQLCSRALRQREKCAPSR